MAWDISSRPACLLMIVLLAMPCLVASRCECGYSIDDAKNDTVTWVFNDILETDFTKIKAISQSKDWIRQEFNVSAEAGRGKYGKTFMTSNIDTLPRNTDTKDYQDSDAGLQLRVGSAVTNNAIPGSEIDSGRLDMHWGSFRAGMKMTATKGTCAAFFWYFNDTQEIDIEFLSREFQPESNVYPISLVIQTSASRDAGYDASRTGTYQRVNLTFDPTADFHEYRFDYLQGRVHFYADSEFLAEIQGDGMPSVGGHLILQHWSNGNPLWSGGPPEKDALLEVNYVKAYFNSSDPEVLAERSERCKYHESSKEATCAVPNVTAADVSGGGYYFHNSEDTDNENEGQGPPSDDGHSEPDKPDNPVKSGNSDNHDDSGQPDAAGRGTDTDDSCQNRALPIALLMCVWMTMWFAQD